MIPLIVPDDKYRSRSVALFKIISSSSLNFKWINVFPSICSKHNFSIVGSRNAITSIGMSSVNGRTFTFVYESRLNISTVSFSFLLRAMIKLTSSGRYASSLLRCSIGFIPVKSVKYFFDLTDDIGFSQRLSDRIVYTYSPVFVFLDVITVAKRQI